MPCSDHFHALHLLMCRAQRQLEQCCEAVRRLALLRPHITFLLHSSQKKAPLLQLFKVLMSRLS
jgi:hypothetical protein